MFELLVYAVYKFLASDHTAIDKIPGPMPEPVELIELEIFSRSSSLSLMLPFSSWN